MRFIRNTRQLLEGHPYAIGGNDLQLIRVYALGGKNANLHLELTLTEAADLAKQLRQQIAWQKMQAAKRKS